MRKLLKFLRYAASVGGLPTLLVWFISIRDENQLAYAIPMTVVLLVLGGVVGWAVFDSEDFMG